MAEQRLFAGANSRSQLKVLNNLGTITRPLAATAKQFRKQSLDLLDAYYEARQYAGMPPWAQSIGTDDSYIPVKQRQPMLQLNFAKLLTSRVAAKLVGRRNFPEFTIEDDPDTTQLLKLILKTSNLRSRLIEPTRRMLNTGSVLVRFSITDGAYRIEHFLSKWCFPDLDSNGNLEKVRIQYVFSDENDLDPETREPKQKWFKMVLGKQVDTLFDTPEFEATEDPIFKQVDAVEHNLGFVQAEWMRTDNLPNTVDGPSIIEDILGFIDELNYNFSQSSQAVSYNQDPQLTLTNMDEDEIRTLIKSSVKGWNLGKEGEASFLESSMNGVVTASDFRDKVRLNISDIARVALLDPEKLAAHAQSGRAMEILHGPMVELVDELQPGMEKSIISLMLKMMLATFAVILQGGVSPIDIPPGFKPKSLDITTSWPEFFAKTMEELQKKVTTVTQATTANLISRETGTRFLAKDFGVDNIEEEVKKVNAQPIINPFGGF